MWSDVPSFVSDFTITSFKPLLAASKNKEYRENILIYFCSLIEFLQRNMLTTKTILEFGERPNLDAKLMRSDLTDEGYEFLKSALNNGKKN